MHDQTPVSKNTEDFNKTLEGYKHLAGFQMWAYDTHFRDYHWFLTIEVVLAGAALNRVSGAEAPQLRTCILLWTFCLFGVILSLAWASRKLRAFAMHAERAEALRRLELVLSKFDSDAFKYHSEILEKAKARVDSRYGHVPLLGRSLRILPNLYRRISFHQSLVVEQLFIWFWILLAVFVTLRWHGIV